MSQFGELALAIGDFHIPQRALDLPDKFKELLVPGKVQHIFCTGNIGNRETTDWIKTLASDIHLVRGDFDEGTSLPLHKVVQVGDWKIGLIHGHQIIPWGDIESLANVQRQLDVDILISGHNHSMAVTDHHKKFFINPGSVTGAYSSVTSDPKPSFIIMAFQGSEITLFLYDFANGAVNVNKTVIKKN